MIQAMVKMDFAPQTIHEALQILHSIVERTRAEAGCISCSVYRDMENEHLFVFEETWRSEEALQHHLRSEDYRKVLLVMEMAITPPVIRFDTITDTGGVEVIVDARSKTKE